MKSSSAFRKASFQWVEFWGVSRLILLLSLEASLSLSPCFHLYPRNWFRSHRNWIWTCWMLADSWLHSSQNPARWVRYQIDAPGWLAGSSQLLWPMVKWPEWAPLHSLEALWFEAINSVWFQPTVTGSGSCPERQVSSCFLAGFLTSHLFFFIRLGFQFLEAVVLPIQTGSQEDLPASWIKCSSKCLRFKNCLKCGLKNTKEYYYLPDWIKSYRGKFLVYWPYLKSKCVQLKIIWNEEYYPGKQLAPLPLAHPVKTT